MPSADSTTQIDYRLIPGFPLYRAGTDGTIWSRIAPGFGPRRAGDRWRRLKCCVGPQGYPTVSLAPTLGEKMDTFRVHTLILMTFVGPCPPGMEACHNNGIRTDNRTHNLRWDTRRANVEDMVKHGTSGRGSRNSSAKVTEADIPTIREMASKKTPYREITERYGIAASTISMIVHGKNWKHI